MSDEHPLMLKFTEGPKTPGITSKKSQKKPIAFPKGNKLFAGDFFANLDETNTDGTGNGLSNIKDSFSESLQLQMSVLHKSMCIFKAGLSSQVHMVARQNVKKIPDASDPNQNVETTWNFKLKFT